MKLYKIALAVREQDYKTIADDVILLSSFHPHQTIVTRETPDDDYVCVYWDEVAWDRPEASHLKAKLDDILHSLITIDEEGCIVKNIQSEKFGIGVDEEFDELLSLHSEILFDGESLERVVDYELGTPSAEKLRDLYPEGTVIEMVHSADFQPIPQGTFGKVRHVDDAGSIHVSWENGSSLAIVPGADKFRVHGPSKFLCISASTEGNETNTYIVEGKSLEEFTYDFIDMEISCEDESEEILSILAKGDVCQYPNKDEPDIEIVYGASIFGTKQVELRAWRNDVLSRYNQTYIELPRGGVGYVR